MIDRFWSKVDKTSGCWLWTAATDTDGYGRFRFEGRLVAAHRHALVLDGQDITGREVDHYVCHNHACVRPSHLRRVTRKENQENLSGPTTRSKSGVRGVHWNSVKRRWVAEVVHDGRHYTQRFVDFDEACAYVIHLRNSLFTHNQSDKG